MKDIQNLYDHRNIGIDRVGIKKLIVPMFIKQQDKKTQQIIAHVDLFVNLFPTMRGAHMSRFVEILEEFRYYPISISVINDLLYAVQQKLEVTSAYIDISFTYFMEKFAPISQRKSLMGYQCEINSKLHDKDSDYIMKVIVPVSLLCPCSKEISKYGAHNQRGKILLKVKTKEHIFFEALISILESEGSSEVYPLLKRIDEKFITEKSYENPKFVEDIVRDVGLKLTDHEKILAFQVSCESYESIHDHSAFAEIIQNNEYKE